MTFQAALFDLDGVIFDTEPQYDRFWEKMAARFRPDAPEMVQKIKGTTLVSTLDNWFSGPYEKDREELVRCLNAFEAGMEFPYIRGFEAFLERLRRRGIRTSVVTSSNLPKMEQVYRSHPDFAPRFDAILTSEDFRASKPDPDCYLKAAARLGVSPADCIVFEDSRTGIQSGKGAGAFVVGLVTTLPYDTVHALADLTVRDFRDPALTDLLSLNTPI